MKYIIMADGRGERWKNHLGHPKHLIEIDGETLLARTVRLLKRHDPACDVIITSHDTRYEVEGATRYEPQNNHLEIDRFTYELIEPHICFLYGDAFYSEEAIDCVVRQKASDLLFFGNREAIFAIKVEDADVMKQHVNRVRELFQKGEIDQCKGWQVYQSFSGLPFGQKKTGEKYIVIEDGTRDFNSPEDYNESKNNH